jgi:opacity protein-like surface antigen
MKKIVTMAGMVLTALVLGAAENVLTEQEKSEGWTLLWDGSTTAGWRSIKTNAFPQTGWEIKDGTLSVLKQVYAGDIITENVYTNFILKVDFKLTKAANSGVKYFFNPKLYGGTTLEFQILDPDHPDANLGKNGSRKVGSLYDVIPAPTAKLRPLGEWNSVQIVCNGKQVEHWLNGEKLISFERGSEAFRAAVAGSKFKKSKNWGEAESGHILLQDHGDDVSYRNIKIKVLK